MDDFKELIKREYCTRDDIHKLEVEFFNLKMTGSEIEAYTKRSNELAILCPTMVDPPIKRIELYLRGLVPEIQSHVTSANLATIQDITHLAHRLTDQAVDRTSCLSCNTPCFQMSKSKSKSSLTSLTVSSLFYVLLFVLCGVSVVNQRNRSNRIFNRRETLYDCE
ncbi:hypothetical protein HanPI659440_Chr15g0613771 [Helianthus annuus]|nr:hypothetical protein HanPI659440_Chr15g0613771 [Helianthus annuus]